MTLNIRIKLLTDTAKMPTKGTAGAAAWDLYADTCSYDPETGTYVYGTGVAMEIPDGYAGFLFPRSSVYKAGLMLANGVGLGDSDFRGEVQFRFVRTRQGAPKYVFGDRVGQILIQPAMGVTYERVQDLSETARGSGAFGSTGLR
jgi:dUTP pyrophosphatase